MDKTFKVGDKVAISYHGRLTLKGVVINIAALGDRTLYGVKTDRNEEIMYFPIEDLLPVGELTEALFS